MVGSESSQRSPAAKLPGCASPTRRVGERIIRYVPQPENPLPLEVEDVAHAVLYAVEQPERVSVNEIVVRPTEQPK